MKTRIISAIIGVPLILLTLFFNRYFPLCVNILCAIASLACTVELLTAKALIKDVKITAPCMLFAALLPMLVPIGWWKMVAFLFVFYIFDLLIVKNQEYKFSDMSYILTAVCLTVFGLSCLTGACALDETHSVFYVTLCFVIAWVSDAGAYFVGSFLGKHKLCPNVSPKKTIEGAVGGVIIGVIGAVVDALVFQFIIFDGNVTINYIGVLVVAAIGTVTSIIGDLTFSLIKRSCKVKDYGNIIPGHGGILDRCDSIIMTAPMLFVFVQYFPLTAAA